MDRIAIIYDRASREQQANNWSREDARRIGAELAEQQGYAWELRQEVKSGETLDKRPVMQDILNDVQAGKIGAIVVQDFTRLSRDEDGIDGRVIRSICREHGCRIITPQKVYDFSLDADDDMADFNFLVGKIHKRQTIKGLVRGMQEKARQGKQISGFAVMGYDRVWDPPAQPSERPKSHLEVNWREAQIVGLVYRKYLESRSAGVVARWLNENGYRKPVKSEKMRERHSLGESRPFTRGDVTRIVQNPLYAGWATWGKNCTSRHLRDFEAPWVYRPDLQIVDQDTWDRANDLRKLGARTPPRAVGSEYAFSLLLACHCCGGALVGTSVQKSTGRHKKYRCSTRNKSGATVCETGQTVNETVVARAVLPLAAELIEQGLNLKAAMEEAARGMSRNIDGDLERAWRAELADAERQVENVVQAVARGTITDADASQTLRELKDRKAKLERNLIKLEEKAEVRRELLEAIPAIGNDVEGVFWLFLEKRPSVLNQILHLIFARQSVTVEAWGPNSKRQSRVARYRLTDAFAEVVKDGFWQEDVRVPTEQRSRPPWKPPAR